MIIGNMATFPPRSACLKVVLERILPQVNRLNICLNEYDDIPEFLRGIDKIRTRIPEMDMKDVGKFTFEQAEDDHIFYLDDDILYPPDYTSRMLHFYSCFADQPIVLGVHGVIYSDFFDGRHSSRYVRTFKEQAASPLVVNQLGTGTVVALGRFVPPISYMLGSQRYVDVRFAKYCHEHGIGQVCVPRDANWLTEAIRDDTSIFHTFTTSPSTACLAEIETFRGFSQLSPDLVARVENSSSV
jgi:hypothetical protein